MTSPDGWRRVGREKRMTAEMEYSWEIHCIVTKKKKKNAECKFELVVVPPLHDAKPGRFSKSNTVSMVSF